MVYSVYAIYNKERDKIYIGHISDLEKRVARHNGILKNKSTSFTSRNFGTWKVVHSEKFETREEAQKREKELKNPRGRKFIRNLIKDKK